MIFDVPILLIVIIAIALVFDFLNGFHDASNIVATMISSRAFRPRVALGVTAVAHFFGPFIFGVAVAKTIGEGLVEPSTVTMPVIVAALLAAAPGPDPAGRRHPDPGRHGDHQHRGWIDRPGTRHIHPDPDQRIRQDPPLGEIDGRPIGVPPRAKR